MRNSLGNSLYLLVSMIVFLVLGVLAVKIIFYIVPILLFIYLIYKLYKFIKGSIKKKSEENVDINYKDYSRPETEEYYSIDEENVEVVDVEYEEVNK